MAPDATRGHLIVVEGIGGSGKSTLCSGLVKRLQALGWDVVPTREPGGTDLGATLRSMLLTERRIMPWTEAFLFEADRAQTFGEVIKPALDASQVVISDRGPFGTVAYQGFGRGLDLDVIDRMSSTAWMGHRADAVFLVDVEPELAMARKKGQLENDRFDEEAIAFQRLVRQGYLTAAERHGAGVSILDGSLPSTELVEVATTHVLDILEQPSNANQ